jgi:hypothetical protein
VKRTIALILFGAAIGAGIVWLTTRGHEAESERSEAAEKKPAEEEDKVEISHDADDNVVIRMSDDMQGDIGIAVTNPAAMSWAPELKGYGRVMDPAPLLALLTELASARAAYAGSSNELVRSKTLMNQGNASVRALEAAEAAALHDELAVHSAQDRLALSWGSSLANRGDLESFTRTLPTLEQAVVRIDLAPGETVESPPPGARIVTVAGRSVDAEFLDAPTGVDPQLQGRGFIFLVRSNAVHLLGGEAVTGYLKIPGEPLAGVVVPRDAVVRVEGKGWVYLLNSDSESFTRREIALDRPTENGWFVPGAITAGRYVVITGAQTLLSEELKASIGTESAGD